MTFQERRTAVFLVTNMVVTLLYVGIVILVRGPALIQPVVDGPLWAAVILIWVPVQIVLRMVVIIVLSILNQVTAQGENVEMEDELDKLIDLKSTRLMGMVFILAVCLALGTQVAGLSLFWLFATLGGGLAVGALAGDAAQLLLYRRGF